MSRRRRYGDATIAEYRGLPVSVSSDGRFSATVGVDRFVDDTLAGLKKQLDKALRKTRIKVAIPFMELGVQFHEPKYGRPSWIEGGSARLLTLTGLHSNGNVYVRDEKTGELEQMDGWGHRRTLARPLSAEEIAEYERLRAAKSAASKAFYEFEERVKLPVSLRELVKRARDAAASDAATIEQEDARPLDMPDEDPR